MKLTNLLGAISLTSTVLAAPGLRKRSALHSKPNVVSGSPGITTENGTYVSYSDNWAGAVLVTTGVKSVTGTFTVPSIKSDGSGAAWVGIDGDTCQSAILQTGIQWTTSGGSTAYSAWYEWYPDYSYDFSGLTINEGDSITVTVTASSKTGGKATVLNNSSGKSKTHSFSGEGSTGTLCETNAEWIVEDFEEGGSLVSFADFGSVKFTGASAVTSAGTVGVSGTQIIDIQDSNDDVLTTVSASGNTVSVQYTGK